MGKGIALLKRLIGAILVLQLAACGGEEPEPEPAPSPSPTFAEGPRKLVPASFTEADLVNRIEGPEGTEVERDLMLDDERIGTILSFVACPGDIETCDPAELPEETIYTYVHRVTLEEDTGSATRFSTARPAPGFSHAIGFSDTRLQNALGEEGDIQVSIDEGRLIWRVAGGDGWTGGETLAFFWQSTLPPEGPSEAYEIELDGETASAIAPFPSEEAEAEAVEE